MAYDATPGGDPRGPWCKACQQPIMQGQRSTHVTFNTDPSMTGLYHRVCSKPFEVDGARAGYAQARMRLWRMAKRTNSAAVCTSALRSTAARWLSTVLTLMPSWRAIDLLE